MIGRWLKRPENIGVINEFSGSSIEKIEADTTRHISRSLELSQSLFGRFIELFGLPERTILLGSGHGKPAR